MSGIYSRFRVSQYDPLENFLGGNLVAICLRQRFHESSDFYHTAKSNALLG